MSRPGPGRRRRLALAALLVAAGLAVAAYPFRATWWGGLLLAVGEAGVVGGLADWFAVTAIFRRPLGLPIPHTALIPANWEALARRVGTLVGGRVLTRDYLAQEIVRADVADFLARAAARLGRADLAAATGALGRWLAAELAPGAAGELAARLRHLVLARPLAPLLAAALEVAQRHGWDARLVGAGAQALAEALERPGFRAAVGALVDDVLARYRARLGAAPRFWLSLADLLGLVDRERVVAAVRAGMREIAADPEHPVRRRAAAALAGLPERLRTDAPLAARVDGALRQALGGPAAARVLEDAAAALERRAVADLGRSGSATTAWIALRLERARRVLAEDAGLRSALERWLKARALEAVERYHDRLATFVEKGVLVLGPEGAVRLIEEHAGDDLQFIRVNGTVVGGLAGGAIWGVHLLLRAAS